MSTTAHRRVLWLVMRNQHDTSMVTTVKGYVPRIEIDLLDDETTCTAASRAARQLWNVDAFMLELTFDPDLLNQDDEAFLTQALVELCVDNETWTPPKRFRVGRVGLDQTGPTRNAHRAPRPICSAN